MSLALLFIIHGVVTAAAGVVLFVAPELIPGAVGVALDPDAYLVAYLLAAAEIAIAVLSFAAAQLRDAQALRVVAFTFIVFHLVTAGGEAYAVTQGVSAAVLGNVAARVLVAALFAYSGIYRVARRTEDRHQMDGEPVTAQ